MSRIGNMPITVPAGVEVKIDGNHIAVKVLREVLKETFIQI